MDFIPSDLIEQQSSRKSLRKENLAHVQEDDMNQALVCRAPDVTAAKNKNLARKAGATLLVLVLTSVTGVSSALADETTTPASPSEKKDEQKATMPPDVTTPKLNDTTRAIEEKTQTTIDSSQPATTSQTTQTSKKSQTVTEKCRTKKSKKCKSSK